MALTSSFIARYMDLDTNEVGYFISQVGAAAASFGVASADVSAVGMALMEYFGYKCTPPENIVDGPQLDSICINANCPYDPHAECWLYPYNGQGVPPKVAPQCMSSSSSASSSMSKTSSMPQSTTTSCWESQQTW